MDARFFAESVFIFRSSSSAGSICFSFSASESPPGTVLPIESFVEISDKLSDCAGIDIADTDDANTVGTDTVDINTFDTGKDEINSFDFGSG